MGEIKVGDELHCYVLLELKWKTEDGHRSKYWAPDWDKTFGPVPVVSEAKISSTGKTWFLIKHGEYTFNGTLEHGRIVCTTPNVIAIFDTWSER
jgi:hypothetical protein